MAIAAGLAILKYGPDTAQGRGDRVAHAAIGAAVGYVAGLAEEGSLGSAAASAVALGPVKEKLDRTYDSRDAAASMWGVGLGYQIGRATLRSEPPSDEKARMARCNPSWDNPGLEDSGIVQNVASTVGLPSGAISGAVLSGLAGASLRPVVAGLAQAAINDAARKNLTHEEQASAIPAVSGLSSGVSAANAASILLGASNPVALAIGVAVGAYNASKTRDEILWRSQNCQTDFVALAPHSDGRR